MKDEIKEKLNYIPKENINIQKDKIKEMQYKMAEIFFDIWKENLNSKKPPIKHRNLV